LGEHIAEGVDWLTVSMGSQTAADLLAVTVPDEPGFGKPGFARTERRMCLGGTCWRRWEPSGESAKWGLDYESWEASGDESRWLAAWASGRPVRPSRVDICFDYRVEPDTTADVLAAIAAPVAEAAGFSMGINGQADHNTHYVGSAKSERRIRIYRRDFKHAQLLGQFGGPVLRVELVLRDDFARDWWEVFAADPEAGMAAAAAHVQFMTGLVVRDGVSVIPKPHDATQAAEVGQQVLQFLQQNSGIIEAIRVAGVDLFGWAGRVQDLASRSTQARTAKRVKSFCDVGADAIEQAMSESLTCRSIAHAG